MDPSEDLDDQTEDFPDILDLFRTYNQIYFNNSLNFASVEWSSSRMTSCAGVCCFNPGGETRIKLSEPLLKYRPVSDLKNTLLHEMIHAYMFLVERGLKDRDAHGAKFQDKMHQINNAKMFDPYKPPGGYHITIYHSFIGEVKNYQVHQWRCEGCGDYIQRAMNRKPQPADCRGRVGKGDACADLNCHYHTHLRTCGGPYLKIAGPDLDAVASGQDPKGKGSGSKKRSKPNEDEEQPKIDKAFVGTGRKLGRGEGAEEVAGSSNSSQQQEAQRQQLQDFARMLGVESELQQQQQQQQQQLKNRGGGSIEGLSAKGGGGSQGAGSKGGSQGVDAKGAGGGLWSSRTKGVSGDGGKPVSKRRGGSKSKAPALSSVPITHFFGVVVNSDRDDDAERMKVTSGCQGEEHSKEQGSTGLQGEEQSRHQGEEGEKQRGQEHERGQGEQQIELQTEQAGHVADRIQRCRGAALRRLGISDSDPSNSQPLMPQQQPQQQQSQQRSQQGPTHLQGHSPDVIDLLSGDDDDDGGGGGGQERSPYTGSHPSAPSQSAPQAASTSAAPSRQVPITTAVGQAVGQAAQGQDQQQGGVDARMPVMCPVCAIELVLPAASSEQDAFALINAHLDECLASMGS